jgi:hypothetical protein
MCEVIHAPSCTGSLYCVMYAVLTVLTIYSYVSETVSVTGVIVHHP